MRICIAHKYLAATDSGHKKTVLTGHRFFISYAAYTLLPMTQ
jgi:hypothetical protein